MISLSRNDLCGVLEGKWGLWGQSGIPPETNVDVKLSAMFFFFFYVLDENKRTTYAKNIPKLLFRLVLGCMPHWPPQTTFPIQFSTYKFYSSVITFHCLYICACVWACVIVQYVWMTQQEYFAIYWCKICNETFFIRCYVYSKNDMKDFEKNGSIILVKLVENRYLLNISNLHEFLNGCKEMICNSKFYFYVLKMPLNVHSGQFNNQTMQ